MDEHDILERVNNARGRFTKPCAKYIGAVTIEVIREALQANSIPVSWRDVFIHGLPIEFDLIVPRPGAQCEDGVLYTAKDILAVFEIKTSGSFGEGTIKRVKECFEEVNKLAPHIFRAYVTLEERESFRYKVPGKAYNLFWWNKQNGNDIYKSVNDWQRLLSDLRLHIKNTMG